MVFAYPVFLKHRIERKSKRTLPFSRRKRHIDFPRGILSSARSTRARACFKGDTPLVPPFQRGYTPLDTPKRCGASFLVRVIYTLWACLLIKWGILCSGRRPIQGVEEGRSPSYFFFPFPSGEGDTGDGAIVTKQCE